MADRDPRLQAAEALAAALRDPLIFFVADAGQEAADDYWKRQAERAVPAFLAALAAGGEVIVTRKTCGTCGGSGTIEVEKPLIETMRPCYCAGGPGPHGERPCGQCGGSGVVRDIEQQDPRERCPDCVDGKLPTEVIRVERTDWKGHKVEAEHRWRLHDKNSVHMDGCRAVWVEQ